MNIVLYGEERLLLKQKQEDYMKRYHISQEDMNIMTYYCDETPMSVIIEDALTQPFLTEYKMIVLKHPFFLTTQKQKEVSKEDIALFEDYISHDNPQTLFIIYHDVRNFDERKKVVKLLRKHATFIEIEKPTYQTLYKTTRQAIIRRHAEIDDDALELLIDRVGNNLYDMSKEVDKLCLYTKHIHKSDINDLIAPKIEEDVFALTNALLHHDQKKTLKIYQDLMMNNNEPVQLIGLISHSLRQLYQVQFLSRKGYTDNEIAKKAKLNPRSIYPIRKNGESYTIDELLEKIEELSELDQKIKTGKIDRFRGLELFFMKL